jgi:hypothetical protein
MNTSLRSIIGLVLTAMLVGCSQQNAYYELEQRELAKNIRHDSLFFGLYLGMPSKDFYVHCWNLNKQGLIRQGAANKSVFYEINEFKYPAGMDFYPRFHEDKIIAMPLIFSYQAWSPWHLHLYSDSLQAEVLSLMEKWFGEGFLEIPNPNKKGEKAFVKINGNRRISIYPVDDSKVEVDIVDLPLYRSLDKMQNK